MEFFIKPQNLTTYRIKMNVSASTSFSATAPFLVCFKELCAGVPQNSIRDTTCSGFLEAIKIKHIFIMRINVFDFQTGKNTSIAVRQPSTGHQWEGVGQGEGYMQTNL